MQEHPSDNSPVKKLRSALKVMSESRPEVPDTEELSFLQTVLDAIYDESDGSVLRPDPVIVERIKKALGKS